MASRSAHVDVLAIFEAFTLNIKRRGCAVGQVLVPKDYEYHPMASYADKLSDLASSLTYQAPFISGVKSLSREDAILLYGKDDVAGLVTLLLYYLTAYVF